MKSWKLVLCSVGVLALLVGTALVAGCEGGGGGADEVKLIPREVVFGNPSKVSPRLSPDGQLWSYRAPVNGVMNVFVATVGDDDARPVTHDSLRGIQIYFWGGDSKHILYLEDDGGDENWRLCSVNIENGEYQCLTPFEGVQVRIQARDKRHPDELLIAMNLDNPQAHDVYHLQISTGELKKVAINPGRIADWVIDYDFRVRGATAANAEGGFDFLVRSTETAPWDTIISWGSDDALTSAPLGFTKDGGSVYLVDSREANASRLLKMDLSTGDTEVLVEHPLYDVSNVAFNPDTDEPEWVVITTDRDSIVVLDESVRADLEAIRNVHHGDFFVSSRDNADDTWMIGFIADDGPIPYYTYDRTSHEATFLFTHRPELEEYTLARMEPFHFTARDGLEIHGYLSFPPGQERSNLPAVLNVHGGPWYRDTWGFNPEAQWMANRGYLCIQVNFRGSTGYGKDFLNAGNREWAGKCHDDLIDAVNYVIDKGYVDPDKIAIYGGSYGGYAALVGATFTPDVFCCAIDAVGPSSLVTLIESIPPYWANLLEVFHRRIGNPETEREFLESRSPLFRVDSIKIPILVAQGANDPRVKQAEAEQIVAALKEKGLDYEYLLFEDEGHGLVKPENRLEYYAAVEKFLAKHLGGRYEPAEEEAAGH